MERAVEKRDVIAQKHRSAKAAVMNAAAASGKGMVAALGGSGGLIAVAEDGSVELPFDTEGMYRGTWSAAHGARVAIYKEALS
jgi:beta-aspartyl-peptidase (threonine type)